MNTDRPLLVGVVIAMGLAIWYSWHMHTVARGIAEDWLRQHRYKVLSMKAPLFVGIRFGPRLFRNERRATHFRCVVEDRQFGGRGVVLLRVWTDREGLITRQPDVVWEEQPNNPDPSAFIPAEYRLESIQRSLLTRIAQGEHRFAAEQHSQSAPMHFDELVEHLLAMQNRGLITLSLPQRARTPGSMYELVEHAALTDAGRDYLSRID